MEINIRRSAIKDLKKLDHKNREKIHFRIKKIPKHL